MNSLENNQEAIDTIQGIINPLLGHTAWDVKLGVGSFITMEFGNRLIGAHGKSRGEWYLWVYCCGWYLEQPNGIFIGCEDPRDNIKKEITTLDGHVLEAVVISPTAFETNFVFDRGFVLHTFPLNFIDPRKHWMLFTPQGKVLVLGPGKDWSYEFSSNDKG
jgi:hypothetical protein